MSIRLLTTKLNVPPLRQEWVPRRHLLDRLEAGLQRKLTLISAPAGYGKTSLLSEWHAELQGRGPSLAWVLLDEQDNDPVRFWSYLLAAVGRVRPGAEEGAWALLQAPPPAGVAAGYPQSARLQSVLTALVDDLESQAADGERPARLILVLDDYHTIRAPAIHDSVALFLDYLPPSTHLVVLTRADPPLPLARLRARGQLLELRAADLRFGGDEADFFLRQVMMLDLSDDMVSALDLRTEGWAAGLQLAALSLQGLDRQQAQQFVAAFGGTHRHVLSYLSEEVVQRQSPELQAFLLQTSVLPYLTPPLCDAVTGQPGSQAVLERLVSDNLFTAPLDSQGQWYRYHPLLTDALRARLAQSSPDLLPVLHRRASLWHLEQGAPVEAVRHALAAGDPELAAQLVEAGYKRLVMRGELVTLHRWLEALPADLVQSRPRLCLAYALALAYSGRRERVEGYLQQAETALAVAGERAGTDAVRGEIAALRAVFASVNWVGACSLDLARRAVQLMPAARSDEDLWLRILTLQAKGNCHRFQGEVREAEASYVEALAIARRLDSPFLAQAITNRLGQNQLLQGRLREAGRTFEAALGQAEARGGELAWFSAELHAHLSQVYTEWNELDRALEHSRQSIELGRRVENRLAQLEGYRALAGVEAARGEAEAAGWALDQARELAIESGVPYLEAEVTARRAWLDLVAGESDTSVEAVRPWAEGWAVRRTEAGNDNRPLILREFQDLVLARFWLWQGQLDRTIAMLAEIQSAAEAAGRIGTLRQALVLGALAHRKRGQVGPAQQVVQRALALARPEGYLRLFLDEGDPMRRLLIQARTAAAESRALLRYLDRVLLAFPGQEAAPDGRGDAEPLLADRLTPREVEILRLMADGASNQQIAERLVVTVGTVKGHVNHILDKLAARNRTEAVARARDLGLLTT